MITTGLFQHFTKIFSARKKTNQTLGGFVNITAIVKNGSASAEPFSFNHHSLSEGGINKQKQMHAIPGGFWKNRQWPIDNGQVIFNPAKLPIAYCTLPTANPRGAVVYQNIYAVSTNPNFFNVMRKDLPKKFFAIVLTIAALFFVTAAFGQAFTATTSGAWNLGATWGNAGNNVEGSGYPGSGNAVTINGGVAVTVPSGNFSALSIQLNGGQNNATAQLNFSGGQITVNGSVAVGLTNGNTRAGSIDMTGGGTLNIAGALTLSSGVSTFTAGTGTLSLAGNFINNGTFTAGTGTVSFDATSARSISGTSVTDFNVLTINDPAGVSLNSVITVNGNLNLTSGAFATSNKLTMGNGSGITRSGGTITVSTTLQTGTTYNVIYTGNSKTTGPELSGSGLNNVTVNLSSGQTLTPDQARAPQGDLSVSSGIFDLSSFTFNRSVSGGTLTISNGAILKIGGTNSFPSNYSLHTFGPNSTVEYSGAAQTVTNEAYGHLTLSGSGGAVKTLPGSSMTIAGNFTLSGDISATAGAAIIIGGNFSSTSSTFSAGAFTHTVGGNWSNLGTFNGNSSTINFNRNSGTQTLNNSSSTFNNLTHSGNGTLQLVTNNITVNGTLTLTNGIIDGATNSKTVTIGSSGSISGGSSSSYVSGKLLQTYSATGSKTFPIGKGGNYRPLSLNYTALTGTSVVAAEQIESTIPGTIPGGVTVQSGRYWTVSQSGGSSFTYNITLDGTGFIPGTSDANILKGDGVTNTRSNATFSSPNFTSTGFTGFSNFAVASSCDAPTIDAQPTSQSKCVGNSVTFSVTASGSGSGSFTCQWYKVGSPDVALTNGGSISGATSNSLTINPIAAGDAGSYYVIVSRPCGTSTQSNNATLTLDVTAPTIGGEGANTTIECTAAPVFTAPTASDASGTANVQQAGGDVTGGNSCTKTTTRTWLAVDACGNSSATRSQTITQIDTQAPTIGNAADATIECTATPSFTEPTASDACNSYTVVQVGVDVTGGNSCAKTTTRTWRAIDACGNSSATRSQTVTQVDTQAPTIGSAGANETIECGGKPVFTAPTVSDACNTFTVVQMDDVSAGNASCEMTITRTWFAVDACGNSSATRSQTITQKDTQAPSIGSAGANTTIECTATPSFTAPTASDACNGSSVVQVGTDVTGGTSCAKTTTRTWLAVDDCGNSSVTRSQTITQIDEQAPQIGSAGDNTTIECTATPSFTAPTASDACNTYTIVQVGGDVTGGNSCAKTTTRTWIAIDACGNSSETRSQTITQVDTQAPAIGSAGANETIECTATPSFTAPTASDACNTFTVVEVGGDVTGGNSCAKTTTRTWIAIDACGNSSATRSQTVTQSDSQAPTIGNAGANSTIECTATPSFTAPTASDACNTFTVVQVGSDVTGGNSCAKTTTRTWLAVDACGNSSATRSQTVTQADTQAPAIGDAGAAETIECTATPSFTAPTASDACNTYTVVQFGPDVTGGNSCAKATTRTWLAVDVCGNSSGTRSQTITQVDTRAPAIGNAGANTTIECTATPSFTVPTASDACNTYTVVQVGSDVTAGNSCVKTTTRTWLAVDACGNSSGTLSQTITQVDTQAPTIGSAGANTTIECTATPVFTAPTASDACNGSTLHEFFVGGIEDEEDVPAVFGCAQVITKGWYATDACGNSSATVTQTITIVDTHAPTIGNAGANTTIECTATPVFTAPTASDACNISTVVQVGPDFTSGNSCVKTTTRTWRAIDICGNASATRSQTITQVDTQAPTIGNAGANDTIECTATPVFTAPTASDACNTYTVVQVGSDLTSGNSCLKTTTRTWRAIDACGNSSDTRSQTITQVDTNAPAIGSAGANSTIECTATPVFTTPTASDACSTYTVMQVGSDDVSGNSCVTTITRTWLAVDACGNSSATRSQTITKVDTQAPIIGSAGANTTIECTATPVFTAPTASDACSTYTVVQVGGDVIGGNSCAKTTTRTWLAVDACGNSSATRSQTVTQVDTQAPTIGSAGANETIECTATPSFTAPTASDACNTYTVVQVGGDVTGGNSCAKTTTRTWRAIDACGNSSVTRSQTVTQVDTQAPSIGNAGNPVTIECTATPLFTAPTASDACNTFTVVQVGGDVTGGNSCAKTTTRTWRAIDACGNSSVTRSQTVTQVDTQAPVITCPSGSPFTRSTNSGSCSYTIVGTEFNATATDACSAANLSWTITRPTSSTSGTGSTVAGQTLDFGSNTITWTANDGCGNSSTCSVSVTVNNVVTTTTVTVSPNLRQYSDSVRFVATVTPANCGGVLIGGTVTFKVNGVVMGIVPVAADGTATLDADLLEPSLNGSFPTNGPLKPGVKNVVADYNGTNSSYTVTDPTTTLTIDKEDAMLTYNGFEYFTTPGTSCPAPGNVTFSASVIDTIDNHRGDIRNATIFFQDQFGAPYNPVLSPIQVGPVTPGDYQQGIATYTYPMTLSGSDCNNAGKTIEVWTKANNYYTGSTLTGTLVTLALPGQENVTGGGHLNITNSAGCYAATSGSHMNFGFTIKWNKSGKNLQGQINILFRRFINGQWRTYQIKSNAINSMSIQNITLAGVNYNVAYIVTKANLTDVTNPNSPVSLGGNLDLQLEAWDCTTNSTGQIDKIGVQLMGSPTGCTGNGLVFSSFWSGTATVAQYLTAGNINIRTNGSNGNGSPSIKVDFVKTENPVQQVINPFEVKAFPNPSDRHFTIVVESNSNAPVQVNVFDITGRQVTTLKKNFGESIQFGDQLTTGTYVAEVVQGDKRKTIKLVKQ